MPELAARSTLNRPIRELFSSASSRGVIPELTKRETSSRVDRIAASRLSGFTVRLTVKLPGMWVAEREEWMP